MCVSVVLGGSVVVVYSLVVNALVAINKVALHRARLVLGWVNVCGQVNHVDLRVTNHLGQLSLPSLRGR